MKHVLNTEDILKFVLNGDCPKYLKVVHKNGECPLSCIQNKKIYNLQFEVNVNYYEAFHASCAYNSCKIKQNIILTCIYIYIRYLQMMTSFN